MVEMTLNSCSTKLALIAGLLFFCGCGIQSRSPSAQSQNSSNLPRPDATIEHSQPSAEEVDAVRLVSAALESNKLNVASDDLNAKKNPKGDGVFVFAPEARYSGVERYVIWMVVDSKAYALNSPSKMVTPSLPWPRDADEATWNKTGIDKYNGASEAIEIIFGK